MVRISAFFEVSLYSVHVYGRGTLCYGKPQYFLRGQTLLLVCLWERDALLWYDHCFLRGHTLLRSFLWKRDALLWYTSVLSSTSHFTSCTSMREGHSVMVRISAFFEVVYSMHVYGKGTLCYGTSQCFIRGHALLCVCPWGGTLGYGTYQCFLRGHTLLRACLWESYTLLWYASVLSSRSHFTPCMSMGEGRSVMVRFSAFFEVTMYSLKVYVMGEGRSVIVCISAFYVVTIYSVHVYVRGTLCYGAHQCFL